MALFRGIQNSYRATSLFNSADIFCIVDKGRLKDPFCQVIKQHRRFTTLDNLGRRTSGISCVKPIEIRCLNITLQSTSSSESASSSQSLSEQLLASKIKAESTEGAESDSAKKEEERRRTVRALKFSFIALGCMISAVGVSMVLVYGAPPTNEQGVLLKDEFSELSAPQQYFFRTLHEMKMMNKMIQEPTREQLLPDPLKEPYIQPPYTLVLELKDVLVHPEWTYNTGWRFKKRPGVDFLLQHCAPPLFEIVIYTREQGFTAYPVIEQLDPNGFIWYKLFKDSTRYENGKHYKDLYCLNRDLNKVIMVDWDPDVVMSQRNQLSIPRWNGEMSDQSLVDLAVMLRTMAESQVSDVREVLDYYRKYDNPVAAFMENQRIAQEQEKELLRQREEAMKSKSLGSSFASSFLKRR